MPRPRKPTAVLKLNGAFKHDPARGEARKYEPQGGPLGTAPGNLTAEEKACWADLERMIPAGVLTSMDRWAVFMASRLMAKEQAEGLGVGERSQLLYCMSHMGLFPSDRSKISVNKDQKKQNAFAQIASEIPGRSVN